MGILRLSHVEVRVPDLELATAYYTEVLGCWRRAGTPSGCSSSAGTSTSTTR